MTSAEPSDLPDNLPLLTEVADEHLPDDLPLLTETVEEMRPANLPLEEADMQQLLERLEACLERAFTEKLAILQRQAAEQVLTGLKGELRGLLREMLSGRPSRR